MSYHRTPLARRLFYGGADSIETPILSEFASFSKEILGKLICPISHELMREPVIIDSGITYEKEEILKWFLTKDTCPMTRKKVDREIFTNNGLIRTITDLFVVQVCHQSG